MSSATRFAAAALAATLARAPASRAEAPPRAAVHNVILIVPDGLRADAVDELHAPTMARLARDGVRLSNSHALFPTFTMPNSSALATGHGLGDTGILGNALFSGHGQAAARGTAFIEDDAVLADLDARFGGDLLHEPTLLAAARRKGYDTAAVGKLGPTLLLDHTERSGARTIIIDDSTPGGVPLQEALRKLLRDARLPEATPERGLNGDPGSDRRRGTLTPGGLQQAYFQNVITQVLLPRFKERGKPFLLVFWSRDPDGTQHHHGDAPGKLVPGINGPTSLAAVRNVDNGVAAIRSTLESLGLADTTDVVIAADHGFSTIARQSETSPSARTRFDGVPAGQLPCAFLALDLAAALGLRAYDPDDGNKPVPPGATPAQCNALLAAGALARKSGGEPAREVVVMSNGGSDLIYLPGLPPPDARALAEKIAAALLAQDYVGGLFADDRLGDLPGALRFSDVGLAGSGVMPVPAIIVSFRSFIADAGCKSPLLCAAEVADTTLQQGQGMHGSFSRADTKSFMAAIGPDFRRGFEDAAPASNADVARTIAHVMGLDLDAGRHGTHVGRVLREALAGGPAPRAVIRKTVQARVGSVRTEAQVQEYEGARYYDAAGIKGRTVGLP